MTRPRERRSVRFPLAFWGSTSRSVRSTSCRGRFSLGSVRRSAIRVVIRIRPARRSRGRGARASRIVLGRRGRCRSASAAGRVGSRAMSISRCGDTCPIRRWVRMIRRPRWQLAALVLIKDKGAPTGQPIDAYRTTSAHTTALGLPPTRTPPGCSPTRTPTRAPGPGGSGHRAALRWGTPLVRGREGEDPAERRRGRAGRRPGGRAADDRGGQPDRPLRLQLRRRARRPGADDEPVQPGPRGGARGRRRTAARGMTARRRPRTCCGAAASGRACSAAACRDSTALESVGVPGPGKWVTIYANVEARLHRGRGHLLRHRGGARQPAQPAANRAAVEQRGDRAGGVRRAPSPRAVIGRLAAARPRTARSPVQRVAAGQAACARAAASLRRAR